jgi:hypothetical protein
LRTEKFYLPPPAVRGYLNVRSGKLKLAAMLSPRAGAKKEEGSNGEKMKPVRTRAAGWGRYPVCLSCTGMPASQSGWKNGRWELFRCPLCASEHYVEVRVQKPSGVWYTTAFYECLGCSVMFRDPVLFARPRKNEPQQSRIEGTRLWIIPPSVADSDSALRQFTEGENILPKLRGGQISDAARALPAAESDTNSERTVEAQIAGFGLVRFVFTKHTAKKGKSRSYFWSPQSAVVLSDRKH